LYRILYVLAVKERKDFVYLLDNVPHDWLFLQCKAVVGLSLLYKLLFMIFGHVNFVNMVISSRCITVELEQQLLGLRLRYSSPPPSHVVLSANFWVVMLLRQYVQCPTTIVPFFGDQPFWGDRVHARGVGPAPIPIDQFSLEKLVGAINFMLDPQVLLSPPSLLKIVKHELMSWLSIGL
jgi:hypothetical protein